MKLKLSKEEIDLLLEALNTERTECLIDISNDEKRGRDTKYRLRYKAEIELLTDRLKEEK